MITNIWYKSKKSVVPFVPTDIAGCQLWLKADAGITKDGSNYVSAWLDQSGNNNHAVQATGSAQPLWVDNQLNGKPSLCFIYDGMTFPDIAVDSFSAFFIIKRVNGGFLMGNAGPTLPSSACGIAHAYGNKSDYIVNVVNYAQIYQAAQIVSDYFLFNPINNHLTGTKWYYDSLLFSSDVNYAGNYIFNTLGYRGYEGLSLTIYYVTEVILYDSTISDSDRQLVETYLNTKYALW
jgi:hypothetical protein